MAETLELIQLEIKIEKDNPPTFSPVLQETVDANHEKDDPAELDGSCSGASSSGLGGLLPARRRIGGCTVS